jgi:hypothetical protein
MDNYSHDKKRKRKSIDLSTASPEVKFEVFMKKNQHKIKLVKKEDWESKAFYFTDRKG